MKLALLTLLSAVSLALVSANAHPPTIAGTYFATKYEGNPNNWHYVTVTEKVYGMVYTWKNRAGVSWDLTRESPSSNTFKVSKSCPYYKNGYTKATITTGTIDGKVYTSGIYGPWKELYQRVPPSLVGKYFATKYEGKSNNWHRVTVTEKVAGKVYTWKNRAGVSWDLTRESTTSTTFKVSESCPYYSKGYTKAKITMMVVDGALYTSGIYGPWMELYERVPC